MWLWPPTGCLWFEWLCQGVRCPGLSVVALASQNVAKEGAGCERLWFMAWACVAWLELCGLRERESCGLRAPGSVS